MNVHYACSAYPQSYTIFVLFFFFAFTLCAAVHIESKTMTLNECRGWNGSQWRSRAAFRLIWNLHTRKRRFEKKKNDIKMCHTFFASFQTRSTHTQTATKHGLELIWIRRRHFFPNTAARLCSARDPCDFAVAITLARGSDKLACQIRNWIVQISRPHRHSSQPKVISVSRLASFRRFFYFGRVSWLERHFFPWDILRRN